MSRPGPLQVGGYYHVYSRGNNRDDIFVERRNYAYFLKLYALHIEPVADTFAYCLMPNHFHVLVRIKEQKDPSCPRPSQSFSNLLNAYARAFNNARGRTGALFQRPFGRIEVTSDSYFARLVVYIHRNPKKHGFVDDFREWPYSSYHTLLATQPTRLKREEVLGWFGSSRDLVEAHLGETFDKQILELAPEDFDV